MFKSKLFALYADVPRSSVVHCLNVKYYEELKSLGYSKTNKYIPPKALKKFFELFGEPINEFN